MDTEHGAVPDDLVVFVDFLNTVDLESGDDVLSTATMFSQWSAQRSGLRTRPSMAETKLALDLRDGLRSLAQLNSGMRPDRDSLDRGTRAASQLPLRVAFKPREPFGTFPRDHTGLLRQILASYVATVEQDRWPRIKLCAAASCRWAFWDDSRNSSRRWCSMERCGSREKMRQYRRRAKSPKADRPRHRADPAGKRVRQTRQTGGPASHDIGSRHLL